MDERGTFTRRKSSLVRSLSLKMAGRNKELGMTLFTRHDCFKKGRRSSIAPSGVTRARRRRKDEKNRGWWAKKCAKRVETRRRRRWRVRTSLRPPRLEDTAVARKAEEKGVEKISRGGRLFYWAGLKSILGADCL